MNHRSRRGVALSAAALLGAALLGGAPAHATPPVAQPADAAGLVEMCPNPGSGHVACMSLRDTTAPVSRGTPSGWGPADIQSAYKLPVSSGAGRTIAIVDAFDDPAAEADLAVYRAQYGLPPCTTANGCFSKVNQAGGTAFWPKADDGWDGEISLDLDMVSAACPLCHILLVEATDNQNGNMDNAVDYATRNAKYVSNSWGAHDYSGQTDDDSNFNRRGVVITASSGDGGYAAGPQYPASSQYVTAVGGTVLSRSSNARGWDESAWFDAGTGCSLYDPIPPWQQGVYTGPLCSMRATPDVAAVAANLAIYDSIGGRNSDGTRWNGWAVFGGTSAAAPIVAATYALAGVPGANDYPASYPYKRGGLFDITTGTIGGCGIPVCVPGPGWDGSTGLGTPNGINAFSSLAVNPGSATVTAGAFASVQASASGGGASYTWRANNLPAGLSINAATGVISGVPTGPGTATAQLIVSDSLGATSQNTFFFTINTRMPDVVGLNVSAAQNAITGAGLGFPGEVFRTSCDYLPNTVFDQSPDPNTSVSLGSGSTIYIAQKPKNPCP
jgi:hypothetical protein